MGFQIENFLLFGSVMLIFSILIGKAGYRFGMPSLLLFLAAGMIMGSDGFGMRFDSHSHAQFIGTMALSVILFTGGLDTKISSIRPVINVGIILATIGVLLTAFFTGAFIYVLARLLNVEFSFIESMLLASVMSSTDSASVFALLRSKGLALKENLRPLLELESGSNDPMAFMLVITLIGILKTGQFSMSAIWTVAVQVVVGILVGVVVAKIMIFAINRLRLETQSIYSVFVVACVFLVYSLSDRLGGNGYLSVYLAGLIAGNNKFVLKRSITRFFEDFTWLWQIVMFVALGLLVNPTELLDVVWLGLGVGIFMILVGRPLSIIICMAPFKKFSRNAIKYISWVGLRGAVPIIFATYLFTSNVEHSQTMFNIVFFITILSLVVQGMTVAKMAKWLGVDDDFDLSETSFGVEFPDEIKSAMVEILVDETLLETGNTLAKFNLPANTLVMMVRRGDSFFVPRGDTEIQKGDKLLVISDRTDKVSDDLTRLRISHYRMARD